MSLFRRRTPRAGSPGGALAPTAGRRNAPSQAAEPPGWDGAPRGEAGIHGIPRARRWDAVVSAAGAGLDGEEVMFVAVDGRLLIADPPAAEGALEPLAAALEGAIEPPYRAEAVRRGDGLWAVGAARIVVASLGSLEGDEAELVVTRGGRALHVDGRPVFVRSPALERLGEAEGREYVVRARRLDAEHWEVEATAL